MNWINIETSFLRSPEFIGAEPEERATWLSLLGYCCEQENSGKIILSKSWKDRRWQQTCGVTLSEVTTDSELWSWDGETLVLHSYPIDKQREVQAKRKAGKKGGKASGEARREAQLEAQLEAHLQGELERKGKEGKGKEGNRMEVPPKSPKGDGTEIVPKGWRQWKATRQKTTKALRNTEGMSRLGALFGRRESTIWSVLEAGTWIDLSPTKEDVELIEEFYQAVIPQGEDFRRRDLITLLNNWNGECDRARLWQSEQP